MVTSPKFLRAVTLALLSLVLAAPTASAHGGVVQEEDACVIKINYLRGHFKIYQPRNAGRREFCEDLPDAAESVFVLEYLHDGLARAPIDFRIIRDVTGKGRFARWADVAAIDDIDAATVFYRPPAVEPDVFTVVHDFDREGDYVGIVTARVGTEVYRAVFPFEVGFTGFGYWPWIIAAVVVIQLHYLVMSRRRSRRRRPGPTATLGVPLALLLAATAAAAEAWPSAHGLFTVEYASSLEPIAINRMHRWELKVLDAAGEPVSGAKITVDGGMPAHNHGLPTRPQVTAEPGPGRYRVEGMRFHMAGHWEISVTIAAAGREDTVVIPLDL